MKYLLILLLLAGCQGTPDPIFLSKDLLNGLNACNDTADYFYGATYNHRIILKYADKQGLIKVVEYPEGFNLASLCQQDPIDPRAVTVIDTPPKWSAIITHDTIDFHANEMLFIRIAGTLFQVEKDGRWFRQVGEPGTIRNFTEVVALKIDPFSPGYEEKTDDPFWICFWENYKKKQRGSYRIIDSVSIFRP